MPGIRSIRTKDGWYCAATCREAFPYKGDYALDFSKKKENKLLELRRIMYKN